MKENKTIVNRLKTTALIKGLMDRYYEELRSARDDNKMLAWTYGPAPFDLLRAMDIRFEHLESYGAYLAARNGQDLKKIAENEGYSQDVCSYARLTRGVAALSEQAETSLVNPAILVPRPDFVVGVNSCLTMGHIYDFQRRLFNVPGFMINAPIARSESEFEAAIVFIKQQMEDLISFLEDISGRSFDYDRLKEMMSKAKEAALLRVQCMEFSKRIPSPITIFDHFVSLGAIHVWRGTTESVEYFKKLKEEVEERAIKGIGVITDERFRLYWDNLPIWFKMGRLSRKLASLGANLIAGIYTHDQFFTYEPEKIDPDDALYFLAKELAYSSRGMFGDIKHKINVVEKMVRDYSIDGLVMHSSRTCRPVDIGQREVMNAIERRLGVPSVMIDGDPTDPRYYSDAQTENRLEAFVESLEARRKYHR